MDSARELRALRQTLSRFQTDEASGQTGRVPLGAGPVDAALGGGLAQSALHEIFAPRTADFPAAAGFAAGVSLRLKDNGPLLWVRQRHVESEVGRLYAQGLAEMGVMAGEMILVRVGDVAQALRAGLEALRCAGLGAVVIELWGTSRHLDLTATRRLALAASETGVMGLMVRAQAVPEPSAAATRWAIATAPSADPFGLPGQASFSASLLRQRGSGAQGEWVLEWNHGEKSFAIPALSGALSAAPSDRPARADRGAGWAHTG